MTLRERIADWISGGALTLARSDFRALEYTLEMAWASNRERHEQLRRIAAQETPSANATVRRMARIARGEE